MINILSSKYRFSNCLLFTLNQAKKTGMFLSDFVVKEISTTEIHLLILLLAIFSEFSESREERRKGYVR